MCELMETAEALRTSFIVVPVQIGAFPARGNMVTCRGQAELNLTLERLQKSLTADEIQIYQLSKTLTRHTTWEPV